MTKISKGNIFDKIPQRLKKEMHKPLVEKQGIKVQRILSQGQTTEWLNQKLNEWVILLKGQARLLFKQKNVEVMLKTGDYIHIPKGCVHKVGWTDPKQKCIWLTVSYRGKK